MLSVRPKVAELAFHVFSRALHPELYVVHKSRTIQRGNYRARIDITNCGHVITWNVDDSETSMMTGAAQGNGNLDPSLGSSTAANTGKGLVTITEVATSAQQPLPKRRLLLSQPLKGSRTERAECRSGVNYRTHFQLEPVSPDVFWMVQQQLDKGPTEGLLHHFEASGRIALGALSYVSVETRERSMRIQAIHTFPDDYAIVKVESLFSLAD